MADIQNILNSPITGLVIVIAGFVLWFWPRKSDGQ